MDRKDLQSLSRVRLKEAKALFRAGLHDGSYYLAGYSIECALKACIAKSTKRHEFPDKAKVDRSYVHNLASLLQTAGLDQDMKRAEASVRDGWALAAQWSEQTRYKRNAESEARALISALAIRNGVLTWIMQRW